MADRYLVATGTWDATNTALWAASSGGAAGASAPTSSDNVFIDSASPTGTVTIAAGAACNNLTVTWTAAKTNLLSLSADFAPAGALSINGNSVANRIRVQSNVSATQRTITVGTAPTLSNVNFRDIVAAGAGGTWSGTSIGDSAGNSGITADAPTTCTANGTTSFQWSNAARWSPRAPLPQDDAVVSNAFAASQTITMDLPDVGRSVDFSGCTGSPALSVAISVSVYGSFSWNATMTATASSSWSLMARGAATLRCNGGTFTGSLNLNGAGGTWTLLDAWSGTSTAGVVLGIALGSGSFDANGFNVTLGGTTGSTKLFLTSGTLNFGSGTWTITAAGTVFQYNSGTIIPGTSTIKLTDASASTKTFAGGSRTFYNLWFNNAGSGALQITGSNTFNELRADSGRLIQFTAGTTTSVASLSVDGCTLGSITAASHTLSKVGGGQVIVQSAAISRSTATPGTTFYALNGSTDGGNNSGWTFGAGRLAADAAEFAVAGQDAAVRAGRRIGATVGAYAVATFPATLSANHLIGLAGMNVRRFRAPARTALTARPRSTFTAR